VPFQILGDVQAPVRLVLGLPEDARPGCLGVLVVLVEVVD